MVTALYSLRWCDVDPTGRAFSDLGLVESIEGLIRAAAEHSAARGEDTIARIPILQRLEDRIDKLVIARYGAWAAGWRWSAGDNGGGPVRTWCCGNHSLLRADEAPLASSERVRDAVREWRGFLEELALLFSELQAATAGLELSRATEHAASRLLPLVVHRTSAESAWAGALAITMTWYLESCGIDRDRTYPTILEVCGGRFSSWVAPDEEEAATACTDLGTKVGMAVSAPPPAPLDALAAWEGIRQHAFANPTLYDARVDVVDEDGHRRYIEGVERIRDEARAERMGVALDACRAAAVPGKPLTLEQLADWQASVLGSDHAPLRTSDAFAKAGRERYAMVPDLQERLVIALRDASGTEPVCVRAARVYLDICFLHPFQDGNGRAARLALDYVLTRAGLGLHAIEPVILLSRAADDWLGAWGLANLIGYLAGPVQAG